MPKVKIQLYQYYHMVRLNVTMMFVVIALCFLLILINCAIGTGFDSSSVHLYFVTLYRIMYLIYTALRTLALFIGTSSVISVRNINSFFTGSTCCKHIFKQSSSSTTLISNTGAFTKINGGDRTETELQTIRTGTSNHLVSYHKEGHHGNVVIDNNSASSALRKSQKLMLAREWKIDYRVLEFGFLVARGMLILFHDFHQLTYYVVVHCMISFLIFCRG